MTERERGLSDHLPATGHTMAYLIRTGGGGLGDIEQNCSVEDSLCRMQQAVAAWGGKRGAYSLLGRRSST
jgi:hypothetical protein